MDRGAPAGKLVERGEGARRRRGRLEAGTMGDEETHPRTGEAGLGERAEVDDPLVGVERLQRGERLVVEAEQPVRVCLGRVRNVDLDRQPVRAAALGIDR